MVKVPLQARQGELLAEGKGVHREVGPSLAEIDDHITHDLHYNVQIMESLRMSFSVINALDEDPPAASLDLNYDPLTHNAFGRMFKIGLTYTPFAE